MRRYLAAVPILLFLVGAARAGDPAPGPAPTPGVMRIAGRVDVQPNGDAVDRVELHLHPDDFAKVQAKFPDARKFLQDMVPDRADFEIAPDAKAGYEADASTVVLSFTELGAAKARGEGRWALPVEAGYEPVASSPPGAARASATFHHEGTLDNGVKIVGDVVYELPVGATEAAWDATKRVIGWTRPWEGGTGEGRIADPDLKTKDRLMASIYKVYGLGAEFAAQWVAKGVFRNSGTNVVHGLKVRWEVEGYSDWSPWDKFPEVVPGETVVSLYYPVMASRIATLRSNTPALVKTEWRWEDSQGKAHEDDDARKVVILGVNEFVFSNLVPGESFGTWQEAFNNAPLLAAWVSRNDTVVRQFAAMANRAAGGIGASTDDASAVRVLKACYELLRANDFTYQHPPALADKSVSFDVQAVQNVKFPRDVIRDRSGTCIDLAILFASMANSVGLDPYLALIPGHCFPFVKMPGGTLFAVETTGVSGGLRFGSADFDRAQEIGNDELRKAMADGRIHVIEVRDGWTKGISNPELEEFPPDILEKWGIREEGRGAPTPMGPGPAPAPASGLDAAVGVWGGKIGTAIEGGTLDAFVVGIDKAAEGYEAGSRAELTVTIAGAAHKVVVVTHYRGRADGESIAFDSTDRKRSIDEGEAVALAAARMTVRPGPGRIEAKVGNDAEGWTEFTLAPRRDEGAPARTPGPADGVRGSWGTAAGGAPIGAGVVLDAMQIDADRAEDGSWTAKVHMDLTAPVGGGTKVAVDADYAGGREEGDAVRFAKVPWHRTIPATGQKDDIDGNVLVLRVAPDGTLKGVFEGGDGLTFTLRRRP